MPTTDRPRRIRIVIVEDNPATADSLQMLLDLHGYEVRVAYTGPEGRQTRSLRKQLASANQQLKAAVEQVVELTGQKAAQQQEASRIKQLLDSLKPREHEVFLLVAAGLANKHIAARLGLSLPTVKFHRGRLMRKLQLHSVTELARLAEKARLLLPSL
jgi:RNA polymerase sigma factor (sigma-70 family)